MSTLFIRQRPPLFPPLVFVLNSCFSSGYFSPSSCSLCFVVCFFVCLFNFVSPRHFALMFLTYKHIPSAEPRVGRWPVCSITSPESLPHQVARFGDIGIVAREAEHPFCFSAMSDVFFLIHEDGEMVVFALLCGVRPRGNGAHFADYGYSAMPQTLLRLQLIVHNGEVRLEIAGSVCSWCFLGISNYSVLKEHQLLFYSSQNLSESLRFQISFTSTFPSESWRYC